MSYEDQAAAAWLPADDACTDGHTATDADPPPRRFAPVEVEGFRLTGKNLEKWFSKKGGEGDDGDGFWAPVCSRIAIIAECRDFTSTGWALLVEVTDPSGTSHLVPIPGAMLSDPVALRHLLSHYGLRLRPSSAARQALAEYLSLAEPDRRIRFVKRTGWHGAVFVLPDRSFGGAGGEEVMLDAGSSSPAFRQAGTLDDWRTEVAAFAVGNSRLITALCTAFAAPLLDIVGAESGGVHFFGPSAVGKSTLLVVGGSVWGGGGVRGGLLSWRATDNGLESKARAHCDTAMMMDEIGEVDGRALFAAVYAIGNGAGKSRAGRDGHSRPVAEWRTFFASSGEVTSTAHMASSGMKPKAGQQVRLIDIAAVPDGGHGIFEELHGFASGGDLSKHLKSAAMRYYGTACRAFLQGLVPARAMLEHSLYDGIRTFVDKHCPSGADGQVQRVADRFGLLAVAGELASELGVTSWEAGEATRGVAACFASWLQNRGGTGSGELLMAVEQVRRHLLLHANRHFDVWLRGAPGGSYVETKSLERWGVRQNVGGKAEYWATPEGFQRLCEGYDTREVAKELIRLGILRPAPDGKSSVPMSIPGHGKARYYHLVLEDIGEDAISAE